MINWRKVIVLFVIIVHGFAVSSGASTELTDVQIRQNTELANQGLKKTADYGQMDADEIRDLLTGHRFREIESKFEEAQARYTRDVFYEYYLVFSFAIFEKSDVYLSDLDAWVKETGSYVAYTARGIFYARQGFNIRGGNFINEVPQENINAMVHNHKLAAADLKTAIEKNPKSMQAYAKLIDVIKASSLPIDLEDVLQKAVVADPRTYYVRAKFMESLFPKWGGSYEEMTEFADGAKGYLSLNPLLWTFQGEVDAQEAEDYWRGKNYKKAVEYYTAALRYGERLGWLDGRASCYYADKQYENALRDYDRVLYYDPFNETAVKYGNYLRKYLQTGSFY